MNPQSIAQWIVDHPEHAHLLAMRIAELDYNRARQLAWDCDEASDYYTPEDDCDDSDDAQALASAGWGTDEDYGGDSI
jgi:ferritin-like protein